MRYMHWDVLLFPEGSKVPLQEFKTGCYATPDPDSAHLQGFPTYHEKPRQMPTVACFIPNLHHGCPFRVSLLRWQPPIASRTLQAMAPLEQMIRFEARVLLDGICVAGLLLDQQSSWPQVIDTVNHLDRAGDPDLLRFPPFHEELLTQSWWNAGENMGRIKVIIAEGLLRGPAPSPFDRVKNLVSFSFQHAPLEALEDSGIAWPNPGMWCQAPPHLYVSSPRKIEVPDPDAHGHWPRRGSVAENIALRERAIPAASPNPHSFRPLLAPQSCRPQLRDPCWSSLSSTPDPFIEDAKQHRYKKWAESGSSEDQSVPDYSRSVTSVSSHSASNHNVHNTDEGPTVAESEFEKLMASLTPQKDGTVAPANTRTGSIAHTPPLHATASSTAETPASSCIQNQTRRTPVTTRDPPPSATQEPSDVTTQGFHVTDMAEGSGWRSVKVKRYPAEEIKSRKEGRVDDAELTSQFKKQSPAGSINGRTIENKKGIKKDSALISDSKRKRSSMIKAPKEPIEVGPNAASSPARKLSRRTSQEAHAEYGPVDVITTEDVPLKAV